LVQSESIGHKGNNGHINVQMSDYPNFKGNVELWIHFRKEHEATAEVHGLFKVLDVMSDKEVEEHQLKRESDEQNDEKVIKMYGILKKKLACGTALPEVTKHSQTKTECWHRELYKFIMTRKVTLTCKLQNV